MKNPLILALFLASPLHAATVLIDFGATPTTGTSPTWNNFTNPAGGTSLTGLKDTAGNTTSMALTLNGTDAVGAVPDNNTPAAPSPFNVSTVIVDSFFAPGTRTFTLSGLNTALTYDLTFYAYVNRTGTRLTNYTVNGNTVSIEPANTNLGGTGGVATLSSLVPDGSGNLTISVALGTGNTGNWIMNGLAINFVPEPSAALLASLGLIPLLRRRR
ncbi:MAG TPA: hypothetical protein VM511_12650 [Luteolibacter sp.]|jgi:hypothetical protein|nr:hypothetical protein [Luteolibacter sp.]